MSNPKQIAQELKAAATKDYPGFKATHDQIAAQTSKADMTAAYTALRNGKTKG
jgi:hypothetical protein